MNLELLTVEESKKLTEMLEDRDKIVSQIKELEKELKEIDKTFKTFERNTAKRAGVSEPSKGSSDRKNLKGEITSRLKEAGEAGLSITEISKELEIPNASVHSWFSSTGKKVVEIISKGERGEKRYFWSEWAFTSGIRFELLNFCAGIALNSFAQMV